MARRARDPKAAETTWSCQRCTLLNEAGIRICSACGDDKPCAGSSGKGKGRMLRPRPPAAPPVIASFADSQNVDDDDDDDDFVVPLVDGASKKGSKRAASGSTRGRGRGVGRRRGRGRGGSTDDCNESIAEPDTGMSDLKAKTTDVTVTPAAPAKPAATQAASGAQQQPLELDDSDQSDCLEGSGEGDATDSDDAGETPDLLGRGWGAKERKLADERKRSRERALANGSSTGCNGAGMSGGGGGGGSAGRRGRKRQRPLPSFPGDDIFRSRRYAMGDGGSVSDEDDRPLAVRRRVGVLGGERPSFWRWPPLPPAPSASLGDAPSSVDDGVANCSDEGGSIANRSGLLAGDSEEGLGGSVGKRGRSGAGAGAGRDGSARDAAGGAGDGAVQELAPESSACTTQEQKPRRKRSRLSLPRKRADDEREDEDKEALGDGEPPSASTPTLQRADRRHATEELAGEGKENHTRAVIDGSVSGESDVGLGERSGSSRPAAEGAGLPEEEHQGVDGDGAMDVDSSCDRGVAVRRTGKFGESDGRCKIHDGERKDEGGGAEEPRRGAPPPAAREQEAKDDDELADNSKRRCLTGAGDSRAGSSNAGRRGAGTMVGSARLRMMMDVGSLESDSSDDNETQDDPGYGGGAVHLGRAMDQELKHTAGSLSPAAVTADSATAATSPVSRRRPRADAAGSDDVNGGHCLTPPRDPSSPKRRGADGKACIEDSPDSSSMGLVDTPPCATGKAEAKGSTAGTKTTRTSSRPNREVEMLAWSGDEPVSPPLSNTGSRGEWACAQCTYVNRARAKVCGMCHCVKPPSPALTRLADKSTGVGGSAAADDACRGNDSGNIVGRGGRALGGGIPADASVPSQPNGEATVAEGDGGRRKAGALPAEGRARPRAQEKEQDEEEEEEGSNGVADCPVAAPTRSRAENGGRKRGVDVRGSSLAGQEGGPTCDAQDFVGDVGVVESESEENDCTEDDADDYQDDDDDGDYEEDGIDDFEDSEMVGSQIEERFIRSSQGTQRRGVRGVRSELDAFRSPKKQRHPPPPGQVLDLTEPADDEIADDSQRRGSAQGGTGKGACDASADARYSIEDISDEDDDFTIAPGARWRGRAGAGGGSEGPWDPAAEGCSDSPPPPPKYRFFTSVEEHRSCSSSCVDFASLAAAPAGGVPRARSYETRKRARDDKAARSKRGRKGKKSRASSASGRGRGSAGRGGRGRASGRGGGASRSGVRPFGGAGAVPSASWIPAGMAAGLSSSSSAGGMTSGGATAGRKQPYNRYRGDDEMVDDANGGGGFHWEHAGRATFGD